jgi:ribosomal protein L23
MKVIPETYMMKVIPETYMMKVIPDANRNKGNNKITELYKGKVKTHNYINRQNQSTTGKL